MYWPHERNTKKERYLQEKDFRAVKYHDLSVSTLKWRLAFIDCSLCPICFATTHNGVLCWWQRDTMWPWPELELGRLNIRTRENRNEPWRMLLQPPKAHQIAVEWGPGSSDTTIAMSIKCYGSLLTGTQGIKDRTLEIDLLSSHIIWEIQVRGVGYMITCYFLYTSNFILILIDIGQTRTPAMTTDQHTLCSVAIWHGDMKNTFREGSRPCLLFTFIVSLLQAVSAGLCCQ